MVGERVTFPMRSTKRSLPAAEEVVVHMSSSTTKEGREGCDAPVLLSAISMGERGCPATQMVPTLGESRVSCARMRGSGEVVARGAAEGAGVEAGVEEAEGVEVGLGVMLGAVHPLATPACAAMPAPSAASKVFNFVGSLTRMPVTAASSAGEVSPQHSTLPSNLTAQYVEVDVVLLLVRKMNLPVVRVGHPPEGGVKAPVPQHNILKSLRIPQAFTLCLASTLTIRRRSPDPGPEIKATLPPPPPHVGLPKESRAHQFLSPPALIATKPVAPLKPGSLWASPQQQLRWLPKEDVVQVVLMPAHTVTPLAGLAQLLLKVPQELLALPVSATRPAFTPLLRSTLPELYTAKAHVPPREKDPIAVDAAAPLLALAPAEKSPETYEFASSPQPYRVPSSCSAKNGQEYPGAPCTATTGVEAEGGLA